MSAYTKAEGWWKVTTEGDCEGRTSRDLGVHYGFIDDIAFALGDQAMYGLTFKAISPIELKPRVTKIDVKFDIDSGTWNMPYADRVRVFSNLLADRDVSVSDGTSFASVTLSRYLSPEREAEEMCQSALEKIRAVLSEQELKALGL